MTFAPEAQFDPAKLEAAVIEVDFTPTGVTVWLQGVVDTDELPAIGANETAAWLLSESSGQTILAPRKR